MLEFYKPMQSLHWRIPACPQGTSKLKINPVAASHQVKKTQQKKGKKKGERTDESCLMTIM